MSFWGVLQQWQQAIGALIGFLALAAAALFNAHLNRRRDDRLKRDESALLALSLVAEVKAIVVQLQAIQRFNEKVAIKTPIDAARKLKTITLPAETVYPHLVMKIGLLPADTAVSVTHFYGMLAALKHSLIIRMPDLEPIQGQQGWFTIAGGEAVEIALNKAERVIPKLIELGHRTLQKLDAATG